MEKRQEEFKEKYETRPAGELKAEERKELINIERVLKEYFDMLKKISLMRAEYILMLSAMATKYSDDTKNKQHQEVIL